MKFPHITNVKRTKILILGNGIYARPFTELGECIITPHLTADVHDWNTVKLLVFTGGSDVDPEMYSSPVHKLTISDLARDKREKLYYDIAKAHKIPMVGICRGSQFLTVMNGGDLAQHVYSHAIVGTHTIMTNEGKSMGVTSTHHQMMRPVEPYKLLAWADGLSHQYELGKGIARPKKSKGVTIKEPEVVWYPKSKSLAVQYHPEYMNKDTDGYKYFQSLLGEYVCN